ncbi:hypothetical protein EDEG_01209 [Edhazardia aedis USNM 41457]|uniref:Uncharacterized protein n=1 Tax=Edhazardia aedis (strain USNM 41457) TaxID=1003232 RepID=J9DTI6_EDHAE|nr:hypothetical protein EDEG_01209 [Edhazardia aedis USNM 41457]|eukprot:EJW04582.1 hypothetical protein EDEG_01209 [Edhazardia aedis USNM 41457]
MKISNKTIWFLVSMLLLIFTSSSIFFLIQHVKNNRRNYLNTEHYIIENNTENNDVVKIETSTESYAKVSIETTTEINGNTFFEAYGIPDTKNNTEVDIEEITELNKNKYTKNNNFQRIRSVKIFNPQQKIVLRTKSNFSEIFLDTEIADRKDISNVLKVATKHKKIYLDQFILDLIKPNLLFESDSFDYSAKAT